MKLLDKFSFKLKFYFSIFIIVLMLFFILIFVQLHLYEIKKQSNIQLSIKYISGQYFELINYQKDFFLYVSSDEKYFTTKQSYTLNQYQACYKNLIRNIDSIQIKFFKKKEEVNNDLTNLKNNINNLHKNFVFYVELTTNKGFINSGEIGKMRKAIHEIEQNNTTSNLQNLKISVLTLRKHEKDFLLRKDLVYKEKFDKEIENFKNILNITNTDTYKDIISEINLYQKHFKNITEIDKQIGFNSQLGLNKTINDLYKKISPSLNFLELKLIDESEKIINKGFWQLLILIIIFSIVIFIVLHNLSKNIINSITAFKNHIFKLGNGELPEKIVVFSKDEIAEMAESINILTENLIKTKDFAIEVGKGNFSEEISVFNNQGELGNSLLQMKKQLHEVDIKRKLQIKEEENRNWINTGFSKLNEIIRNNNKNINELCFLTLKYLIEYSKLNQGGIFLENNNNQLELIACYAYNRKKHIEKIVYKNEGLIGACYHEKMPIYITQLPDDYIKITSGLGNANASTLLLVPIKSEDNIIGVVEFASFKKLENFERDYICKSIEILASAVIMQSLILDSKNVQLL